MMIYMLLYLPKFCQTLNLFVYFLGITVAIFHYSKDNILYSKFAKRVEYYKQLEFCNKGVGNWCT